MAAIHVAALLVIGPAWSFMLAALATSALIVLPLRWALVGCRRCARWARRWRTRCTRAPSSPTARRCQYLMVSVVFRSVLQFALVWLVAATHELVASRAALAAAAAERERARIEADVRACARAPRQRDPPDRAARRVRRSQARARPPC